MDQVLLRCKRKNQQPRDYYLNSIGISALGEGPNEMLTELRDRMAQFPDVDWETADLRAVGDALYDIAKPILEYEYSQGRGSIEKTDSWTQAGILCYEFYDPSNEPPMPELGTEPIVLIHLPTTAESPGREELIASLQQIARVLENRPELKGVRMTSLLLEYPLFNKKLGFAIDLAHDDGPRPTSFIPREEFLKRYGA